MASEFESLLSLDTMSGEQATRLAVYKRAVSLCHVLSSSPSPEETAELFLEFVGKSAWRLEALELAISKTGRRSSVDNCIVAAQTIADWVQPPANIPVARPAPVKKKAAVRKL